MIRKQEELFQDFSPAEPGNLLYCHQDFLQKIEENRNNPVAKRAAFLLQRLVVDERRLFYKSTRGANRGWRRSRLGGNQGNHFYAWWAPKGAPPLKGLPEFEQAPEGAIFLRDIRHHDDHSELKPQSLDDNYLPLSVKDLRREDYVPSPWTAPQTRFATARQRIRIVKGFPGSGKTTALWQATDSASVNAALYVTYSSDLAALAKAHFQRFAPGHKRFHVVTFSRLVRELLGVDAEVESERVCRARFVQALGALPPRVLGPWVDDRRSLYDEIHANLIGSALPLAIGGFPACDRPWLQEWTYREQRRRFLGGPAVDALLETVRTLEKREGDNFLERFFPELLLAWKAVAALRSGDGQRPAAAKLLDFDCVAVDEAQDLTPIEALVLVQLAAAIQNTRRRPVSFLVAGDEAQTVRPTDFEWGWFHDLVHHQLASPAEFRLGANLRSPRRIARLVNRVWDLYSSVAKQDRPSGVGEAEIEEDSSDQVVYCAAQPGPELNQLLEAFAAREGLAVICLQEEIPPYVPAALKHKVLSVFEAKGLDFQAVCVLDPGRQLQHILRVNERIRRDAEVEPLSKRLAIDQLRVAISRPAERLWFLDVNPTEEAGRVSLAFLGAADPDTEISPVIPAVVLKNLEEETLEIEERVRLCEHDARQFLAVKPEMAWSRAKQAIALLGRAGAAHGVADETVRRSAYLTLAQVSFALAFRRVKLAPELGDPDLWREAVSSAELAGRRGLARIIAAIDLAENMKIEDRLVTLFSLVERMEEHRTEIEPWLEVEISSKTAAWLRRLEEGVTDLNWSAKAVKALEAACRIFEVPDGQERVARLRQSAIEALMTGEKFQDALYLLSESPDEQPKLLAQCYEGLKRYREAAELHWKLGSRKDALRNFRAIPDVQKALELAEGVEDYPAAESLQWMAELKATLEKRPANFARVATAAEKRFVQELLESSLEGPRRKPAPKKTARPRKTAASKTTTKRKS